MKNHTLLLAVIIPLLVSSCELRQAEEREKTQAESPAQDLTGAMPYANGINAYVPEWINYYQEEFPGFALTNFERVNNIPLDTSLVFSMDTSQDFMDLYGNYLIASPNEQQILDLYSYKIQIEKNIRGYPVAMLNNDSEAAVLYPALNRRERILFVGPGNALEDGYWIDNDRLVIIGYGDGPEGAGIRPLIFEVDLLANRIITYQYREYLPAEGHTYLEEAKFADVGF